jgi:sulfonate transport system permease protein
MISRTAYLAGSIIVACLFVALWQLVCDRHFVSPVFLPGPDRTWGALRLGLESGALTERWLATVERMISGWLLASLIGVAVGAAIGVSDSARAYLQPMLEFMRPLPSSAVVPLAISLLGLSNAMVLSVIMFGALWPMLLATIHGFANVEPRLREVSQALQLSRVAFIFKIALPSSLPDLLAGMKLGLTIALILTVVGEMLTSRDGLGYGILLAARGFRAPDLFAGVILLGVTGFLSALVLSKLERYVLAWRLAR